MSDIFWLALFQHFHNKIQETTSRNKIFNQNLIFITKNIYTVYIYNLNKIYIIQIQCILQSNDTKKWTTNHSKSLCKSTISTKMN